ncbi:hypothetical protein P5673_021335 [Acropora cervicornis]|uniref:Uncharacterized protein n=1 Tax=Acropora cervicornis TaxID=6130 RepID=A0AAD9Q811_ACRCE|nr:hypothetical protein P5673_021335 [Acropora cervicornis]
MSHELLKQKWCRLVCDLLLGKTFPHYSGSGIHKKDRKLWIASGFNLLPMILKSQLSLDQLFSPSLINFNVSALTLNLPGANVEETSNEMCLNKIQIELKI